MAYTAPANAVAGTVLTAAYLNAYLRDNILWLATDSPAVRVYNNADLTLTTGVNTALTFNQERFDNAGVHSTSSNTGRLTIPTGAGGKYLFGGSVVFAFNATGDRGHHGWLNGVTTIVDNAARAGGTFGNAMTYSAVYALTAADYLTMVCYQGSGGNLNITAAGNYSPEFWAYWLRN